MKQINNLPDKEFKALVMRMLTELGKRIYKHSENCKKELGNWALLVAQWLRICLPTQGTQVRALVWEDPTCRGATRPVSHNY